VILRDTWSGQNDVSSLVLSKSITEHLDDLKIKLETAQHYASDHLESEQERHVHQHHHQPKSFQPGDKCLILQPESTASHKLRRWEGPAEVIDVVSFNSYLAEYNDARYKLHANLLCKFNVRVNEVIVESMNVFDLPTEGADNIDTMCIDCTTCVACNCTVIYEHDVDFGEITTVI